MYRLLVAATVAVGLSMTCTADAMIMFIAREAGTRVVARDKTTFVLTVYNCVTEGVGQGSFFANHGTVTFKETTGNFCPKKGPVPALAASYTPNPGFTGEDDVQIYFGPAPFHLKIVVRDGAPQPATAPASKKPHRHASAGTGGQRQN